MRKGLLLLCLLFFPATCLFCEEEDNTVIEYPTNYQYQQTQDLVSLVQDAAALIREKGEAAFPEFKKNGSKWRNGDKYIFVMDPEGNMLVHPDAALEGKNQMELKDAGNRFVIKDLNKKAMSDRKRGWFHYQWLEPGFKTPQWKSTFVQQVTAPSGKDYIVGSGAYNMRMEKEFIVEVVNSAVALIQKEGPQAFSKLRDKAGSFVFLDTYVFVDKPDGTELVNGAFPEMEGKNLIDYKDSSGKYLVREYINIASTKGMGWTIYLWPKPGQSKPSKKHTFVKRAIFGNEAFIVGSGAYLE